MVNSWAVASKYYGCYWLISQKAAEEGFIFLENEQGFRHLSFSIPKEQQDDCRRVAPWLYSMEGRLSVTHSPYRVPCGRSREGGKDS